uniref:Uncharacterized protein n=1 Tax=Arundo donax TaxID=35708 RepID=A0A0A9GVP3_ARUDO
MAVRFTRGYCSNTAPTKIL